MGEEVDEVSVFERPQRIVGRAARTAGTMTSPWMNPSETTRKIVFTNTSDMYESTNTMQNTLSTVESPACNIGHPTATNVSASRSVTNASCDSMPATMHVVISSLRHALHDSLLPSALILSHHHPSDDLIPTLLARGSWD